MYRWLIVWTLLVISAFDVSAQAPKKFIDLNKVVLTGEKIRLTHYQALDPDCTSQGKTTIRILKEPQNGRTEVASVRAFPNYEKDNVRAKCNEQQVDASGLWYVSNVSFKGQDLIELEVIFPRGEYYKGKIKITVK